MPRQFLRRAALGAALLLPFALPAPASAAAPPWWSYTRPATFGSIRQAVRVPMRDGVRLACQLTRPAVAGTPAAGRFPGLVYEVTPYAVLDPFFIEQGAYFAGRGYVAITCTVRGAGASGGRYPQINQPAEQTDAYDLVEWLAAQPFSDGRIGQTGESYGAMSSYRAAAARPPHLRAVAPQQAPNDLYLDDIYPGGIRAQPVLRQLWPLIGQFTSGGRIDAARLFAVQHRHPTRDAFWQQIAIDTVLDRIEVPVLAFAGWDDPLFRDGSIRNVERLAAGGNADRTWLIAGPWGHGYVVDWRGCRLVPACVGFQRVPPGALLAWFDHWVAEVPGAPLPSSRVTSFQSGTGGAGWRALPSIGALQAAPTVLALTADDTLDATAGPAGEAAWRATPLAGIVGRVGHLTFTSAPLPEAGALLGRPALTLLARASATDANLHAELRVLSPGGAGRLIAEGWLRASHRRSHADPEPLTPGATFRAQLAMRPVDRALPAGSRLQLRIDSGSAAALEPFARPVQITLQTGDGGSTIALPLG